MIDDKREAIQQEAIAAALATTDEKGRVRCTMEVCTGIGKTFVALHLIQHLSPSSVLFLAETTMREADIRTDFEKFKELYGYDIERHHKITFACYQSAYKWKHTFYDLVVADEIHDSQTEQYFKYFENNGYTHLIGLSATIDSKTLYPKSDGTEWTKKDMVNSIAPIVFTYTVAQGQKDDTSRKLVIFVIRHELDRKEKDVEVVYKDKKTGLDRVFYQTEHEYYSYCQTRFLQQMWAHKKTDFLIRYWANKRNSVLTQSKSKTREIKKLLPHLNRTIVFGNSIRELSTICPTVSSHNSKIENEVILKEFQEGRLDTIGSFKMLKQGKNLVGLNCVVMHSYYSVEKDFIQRVGRLRKSADSGFVFIYVTNQTQENIWFGKIVNGMDLNYIHCENTEDAIDKYLKMKRNELTKRDSSQV